MDSDTEDRILKNLKNNFKNKTLIIISHRISCVKDADNIIVLDNGKIIQSGSHNQLLKTKDITRISTLSKTVRLMSRFDYIWLK